LKFFSGLEGDERNYVRCDFNDEQFLRQRLAQLDGKDHFRVVLEVDGKVIAEGTIDRESFFWARHVAEVRCVVPNEWLQRGAAQKVLWELVRIGHTMAGIEILYTELVPEQKLLMAAFLDAGFVYEATRRRFAKDAQGNYHDVVIMANDIERIWRQLEQDMLDADTGNFAGY